MKNLFKILFVFSFGIYFFTPYLVERVSEVISPDLLSLYDHDSVEFQKFSQAREQFKKNDMFLLIFEGETKEKLNKFREGFIKSLKDKKLPFIAQSIYNVSDSVDFFSKNSPLYLPKGIYQSVIDSAKQDKEIFQDSRVKELQKRNNTKAVNIHKKKLKFFKSLKDDLQNYYFQVKHQYFSKFKRLENGDVISKDGKTAVFLFIHSKPLFDFNDIKHFINSVESKVNFVKKEYGFKGGDIEVTMSGDANTLLKDYMSVWNGLVMSASLSLFLTLIFLYYFFRDFKIVLLLGHTISSGLLLTLFAMVNYFEVLSSNVAYLVVIIMGNSINSAIVFCHYYLLEKKKGRDNLIKKSFFKTLRPTFLAMLIAMIAFFSLGVSEFKVYQDMAILCSGGMLICWLVNLALLSLAFNFVVLNPDRYNLRSTLSFAWQKAYLWVLRFSKTISFIGILFILIVPILSFFSWENLRETDLVQLKDKNYSSYNLNTLDKKLKSVQLSKEFIPQIMIVAKDYQEIIRFQMAINRDEGLRALLPDLKTFSLANLLPSDQAGIKRIIQKIRSDFKMQELLDSPYISEWQEEVIKKLYAFDSDLEIKPENLPGQLKQLFEDSRGGVGNIMYISFDINTVERDSVRLQNALERIRHLGQNIDYVTAGALPVLLDLQVKSETERGSILIYNISLIIILIILYSFRNKYNVVPYLLAFCSIISVFFAAILFFNIKINLLNFISIPMTFALGIDYIANFMNVEQSSEYQAKTFSMVSLMSFTTLISYFSIFISTNHLSLRSFAQLNFIGELVTLLGGFIFFFAFKNFLFKK